MRRLEHSFCEHTSQRTLVFLILQDEDPGGDGPVSGILFSRPEEGTGLCYQLEVGVGGEDESGEGQFLRLICHV